MLLIRELLQFDTKGKQIRYTLVNTSAHFHHIHTQLDMIDYQ